MNKILVIALCAFVCAVSSCKKSSNAPSIVGTWTFTNVTGSEVYTENPSEYDTMIYTYNSADSVYSWIRRNVSPFDMDTITYHIYAEQWSFNQDGTYSIAETYSGNGFTKVSGTTTGKWEYLSSTHTNDGILLTGGTSAILPSSGTSTNNSYAIQTLSGNKLMLNVTNTYSSSFGSIDDDNIAISFSK